jgi:hypothetical protein
MAPPSSDTRPGPEWLRHPQESATSAVSCVRPDKITRPIDVDISKLPELCHEGSTRAKCLAGLLVDLSEHSTTHGFPAREFKLGMGRHAIGKQLGLAPETVSHLFSRMQQDGLLKVNGRQITICDPESLYALART